MKEPSKKDLSECFDGMCLFLANHGWTERDERAVAIRKLIEEKPMATRAWAEGWISCLHDRWKIPIIQADAIVYGMLDEISVEVEEK